MLEAADKGGLLRTHDLGMKLGRKRWEMGTPPGPGLGGGWEVSLGQAGKRARSWLSGLVAWVPLTILLWKDKEDGRQLVSPWDLCAHFTDMKSSL